MQSDFDVVGVVLATDRRWDTFSRNLAGRKHYPQKGSEIKQLKQRIDEMIKRVDLSKTLKKYKMTLYYEDDINSEGFIKKMTESRPDLFLCAAYPQIFSKELISIPLKGAVNFHPSLLPKFRGAHPHYWAIVKGEMESGLTAHFMTEHIDNGDIIAQIKFSIENYDYAQLYRRIIEETPNLIRKVEEFFFKGNGTQIKQDELNASYFTNDREIHHRIFWNIHTAQEIYNLVRGGNAFCFFRCSKITIERCFITETDSNLTNNVRVENGTIVGLHQHSIAIKANSGIVNVTMARYRNRKVPVQKFIMKYNPAIGEKVE